MALNVSFVDVAPENAVSSPKNASSVLAWYTLCSAIFGVAIWSWLSGYRGNTLVKVPRIGSQFAWIARIGYFLDAKQVINTGYSQFKDSMFKICGNDVIVLPNKYVDELCSIPSDRLSAILALVENIEGAFVLDDILSASNTHTKVLQTRLTPKLGALVPSVRQELDIALEKEFPPCDKEWVHQEIYHVLQQIVGRASARVFVGPDLCRNERWLHTAESYTHNMFITIVALRLLPFWAKPIVYFCLPSSWKVYYYWWQAQKQLLPLIAKRRKEKDLNIGQEDEGLSNFLQMLMDETGNGPESSPVTIAQRVLSLTLASDHTTTMVLAETLFDLCANPEYIEELREEVRQAVAEDGGWHKTTLTKMRKLDSFMKESQRVNPPSYMGFKRKVMEPLTLHDGLILPVGAHIEMAIVPIQRDNTENPDHFDGLRYYRKRLSPGEAHKWQFATTNAQILHFGHGKQACPGRFMASNVIKMVLGSILLQYDFKFPEGQGRPKSLFAFEYSFPNPYGKIMFKERRAS